MQHRPLHGGPAFYVTTHELAMAEMQRLRSSTGEVPPGYFSSRYQNTETYRPQRLRTAAQNIRRLESFAAVSGGPFNALFLLGVYKERYSGTYAALLMDLHLDAARLAATALDYKNAASGWTPQDRVLLCEMAFPLYFGEFRPPPTTTSRRSRRNCSGICCPSASRSGARPRAIG